MIEKLIDQPQLSPDIEWLLQTDQASDDQLVEAILGEYFNALSQMIQVMLPNPASWSKALKATIAKILIHRHQFQTGWKLIVWVDAWCFEVCNKLRRQIPAWRISRKSNRSAASLNRKDIISQLPAHQRLVLYLSAVQGLSNQEIAKVTRIKPNVASGRLNWGKWLLAEKVFPKVGGPIQGLVSNELIASQFDPFWQDFPLSASEKGAFMQTVLEEVEQNRKRGRWANTLRENSFIVLIAVCLLLGVWFLYRSDPEPSLNAAKYVIPPTEEVSSRDSFEPVVPLPLERSRNFTEGWSGSLSIWSGTNTIISQIRISEQRMDRRLIEAHIHLDGFLGYNGGGVDYTIQTWMNQADETQLSFTGPSAGIPFELFLVKGDRRFVVELDDRPTYQLQEIKGGEAIQSQFLRDLLFNPPSLNSTDPIILRNQSLTLFGGRQVLSVDQYGLDGKRIARFWLDTKTSFPMRQQLFSQMDHQQVVLDLVISRIEEKTEDPDGIFNANFSWIPELADGGGVYFPSQSSEIAARGSPLADRSPGFSSYQKPPSNLDLASTPLSFQFARTWNIEDQSLLNKPDNLAWIFAGPYYLGEVDFGSPWQMICARSPDGRKMAYVENPGGTGSAGTLHWMSLQPFSASEQLEPPVPVSQLAFAHDNHTLAFFNNEVKAIFLLDTISGAFHKLIEIPDVRSLVWSSDGSSLAFIGRFFEPDTNEFVMVVRTGTGEVTYRRSIDFEVGNPNHDWPMLDWDVKFPVETQDLEMCSLPDLFP